jgi:hypothetical protein
MEAAQTIRQAVARVTGLRATEAAQPGLRDAVKAIKALQGRRFAATYSDMMAGGPYASAARFFLEELYSDRDFADRDAQFARIAGAIEKFFPALVVQTAVNLALLHALTEDLDYAMALQWLAADPRQPDAARYVQAWRAVDRRADRLAQLEDVVALGEEMARLTRAPGLRTMLRMMRGPASAAGLSALQRFLEAGFDTFAAMAKAGLVPAFLKTIRDRESALIAQLFDEPPPTGQARLAQLLGQAP